MILSIRGRLRLIAIKAKYYWFTKIYGMDIHPNARISFGARLDKVNPKGVHIGEDTFVASGAIVFSHDFARKLHADTYVGKCCFIGVNAIIMAGVKIGDECIIGAGTIITKNVPSNSIVVGNPAHVIRSGIHTGKFGYLLKE
ncbi:acyltransferase [uncultured Parabacteroides sp.]|uniref:acyltransferase n=1 Tax=uncultured Parabacteroides sp. TaxID=512312 RepID=UPI00261750FF|nr:acyltransferase [uncultured Parabacteroides sp.]